MVNEKMNFSDSSAHCKSLGGSLALAESAEENQQMLLELGKNPKLAYEVVRSQTVEFCIAGASLGKAMLIKHMHVDFSSPCDF